VADEICGLLNDATDYVVTILLLPLSPEVLEALWQRRSDSPGAFRPAAEHRQQPVGA
jgi:hypothetical protein